MTLDELKGKAHKVESYVDALDELEKDILYAYLHKGHGRRIKDCERTMAKALFQNREG